MLNSQTFPTGLSGYYKLRQTFSKFYRRHYELISKFYVGLKTPLHEGLLEPEFYGDLVYKFNKLTRRNDFSFQFRKIITRYRRIGYNLKVTDATVCMLSFNPIIVDNYAASFNCTPVGLCCGFICFMFRSRFFVLCEPNVRFLYFYLNSGN